MPAWMCWTRRWVSGGRRAGAAPEDPDSGEDAELGGRDSIAGRLPDKVNWLRQCAGWVAHLDADSYPPAVNLRPSADWPDRAVVAAGRARVAAVIDRIAADVDELARGYRTTSRPPTTGLRPLRTDLPRILYRSSSQADSRFPLLSGGGHAPAAQPAGLAARGTALMPDLRRQITR